MRGLALAILLLAACDPAWHIQVAVKGPNNQPLEGAAVGFVCYGNMRAASQATHSGPAGIAEMGNVGGFPSGCDVSVAAPGYETLIIRHDEMCPDDRCAYGTDIEATLGLR